MRKYTLGACIIAKNNQDDIVRLLESISGYVDAVYLTDTGSSDDTIKNAQRICRANNQVLDVSHFKWNDNFADARNYNFAQAKTDWIIWLDSDDTVEHAEMLRDYVAFAENMGATSVRLLYRYLVNEKGQDLVAHAKDRMFKNGYYEWTSKAPIHENAFIKPEYEKLHKAWYPSDETVKVRHWATIEDLQESGKRNLRILKALEKKEGDKPDPRTVFLLGRELESSGEQDEALKYLHKYCEMVKFGHERVNALSLLCKIYEQKGDFNKQLDLAYEALKSEPNMPAPYIMIANAYSNIGKYHDVIDWLQKGLTKDFKYQAGEIQTPQGLQRFTIDLLVDAYANLKEYEKAAQIINSYFEQATDDIQEQLREQMQEVKVRATVKKQLDAFMVLAKVALQMDKLETISSLIRILPDSIKDESEVLKLRRAVGLHRERQPGTITIFTGYGLEEWDEKSVEKGIGGSETAVIEMAKRWGKMGYKVEVFGSVPEDRSFGNVTYRPTEDIDWADKFDIFISWRNPVIFKHIDIAANKRYLWLHDVPNPMHYPKEVVEKIDKVIVLSNFHRSLLPAVPDDKFYVSRNGIDIEGINEAIKGVQRNKHLMVFTSSPDRGLESLLDMMPRIHKEVPEATLIWAYGWQNYDKIRTDADGKKWKRLMQEKMELNGVVEAGRLGKRHLYQLLASASIWAYPTRFPEINCISVQEAQACGCFPISSGFAALKETQKYGVMEMDNEKFVEEVIEALKKRPSVSQKNWGKVFGWDGVAKEWATDLFYGENYIQSYPLVSVICTTIRPGPFRVLAEQVDKQTYKNVELIVVDGRYEERKDEVARYAKDFKFPFLHIPDPDRDRGKYPYGICHACNASLFAANGELLVFLQDFIEIEPDAIEKFVNLYRLHPDKFYTGVDERWGFKAEGLEPDAPTDVFNFWPYKLTDKQYTSRRIRIGNAIRKSLEPMEWELNWAAAPKKELLKVGGWDNDWDKAFGYDNTEIALRYIYQGGELLVDESNLAKAISHWDLWPKDEKGVPDRTKKTNDKRYVVFQRYLAETKRVNVVMDFKAPNYPRSILKLIKGFKNE